VTGALVLREGVFEGQVALVTGAGTGLGRAMAVTFARLGADVVVAGRRVDPLRETAALVEAVGRTALYRPTDIRVPDQVEALAQAASDRFGRIDVLINNAGGQFPAAAARISPNGWRAVIETNLTGTFLMCRAVGGLMMDRGGAIINIVMNTVDRGAPGMAHSGAARAGVVNLTRSLAVEWGRHNIRVNAVGPGIFLTAGARHEMGLSEGALGHLERLVPLGRLGDPDELAQVVAFLASPAARYITGELVCIDGGNWMAGSLPISHPYL
jgi:citronellol/citronellal dehydrogenase